MGATLRIRMTATRTAELLNSLASLDPPARDALRRVLIRDQADRNEIATEVLRYRLSAGDELAEIIDILTVHPEERRKVVRQGLRSEEIRGVPAKRCPRVAAFPGRYL